MLSRTALVMLLAWPAVAGAVDFPAGSHCAALGAIDSEADYRKLAAMAETDLAGLQGQSFTVKVDDPTADRWEVETLAQGKRLMYRMGRNQVTEGWNWHPLADPAREDYYRYKYLPLGEHETEIAPPRIESDLPDRSFEVRVVRRDAYYFAFDNSDDFYARNDADAGFSAAVPATAIDGPFHLVARGRFAAPWRAESTTYWRAIFSQPVERTLKNRYFMGRLETVWFCTGAGRIVAKLGK